MDAKGDGKWTKLRDLTIPANGSAWTEFSPEETGVSVRLFASRDTSKTTAFFHYRGDDRRDARAAGIFDGLAKPADTKTTGSLLRTRNAESKTLRVLADNGVIFAFNSAAEQIFAGTAGEQGKIATSLAAVEADNGTNIAHALDAAADYKIKHGSSSVVRIVLISDGKSDVAEAMRAAQRCLDLFMGIHLILIDPPMREKSLRAR